MTDQLGPVPEVDYSQGSSSALNLGNSKYFSTIRPPEDQAAHLESMLRSIQPEKCTAGDPDGRAGDSLGRKNDTSPAKTQASPGKVETSPSGDCKKEKGKDAKCGANIGASAEIKATAYEKDGVTVGQAKAKAEGSVSKDGISGGVSVQLTGAKAEYNGSHVSASGTALTGKLGVEGEASAKKVGVDACLKGEALGGEVKGSLPIPGTNRQVTGTAGAGIGGAACVKAEVSDKTVGAKVELGFGPKGSLGVSIEKRDQ